MKVKFVCPLCGSDEISEINNVEVLYFVTEWDDDGRPMEFGESKVIWDSACPNPDEKFWCHACDSDISEVKKVHAETCDLDDDCMCRDGRGKR